METNNRGKRLYRLPDGKQTVSVRRYSEEWSYLARPIERWFDMKMVSCDPGLRFELQVEDPKTNTYRVTDSIVMSVDFAERLKVLIAGYDDRGWMKPSNY